MSARAEVFEIAEKLALQFDLDPLLVQAIVRVESAGNPYAVRFERDWKYLYNPEVYAKALGITGGTEVILQMMSFGPMQIMGSVARELGFVEPLIKLCEPHNGIYYGCRKLKQFSLKYPTALESVVASYNAGSPRRTTHGTFVNQSYVDKVFKEYNALKLRGG